MFSWSVSWSVLGSVWRATCGAGLLLGAVSCSTQEPEEAAAVAGVARPVASSMEKIEIGDNRFDRIGVNAGIGDRPGQIGARPSDTEMSFDRGRPHWALIQRA